MPSVSEAVSIHVEDVSVTYRTSLERRPTLKTTLLRFGRRTSGHERGEVKRANGVRAAKYVSHFVRIRLHLFKEGKNSS